MTSTLCYVRLHVPHWSALAWQVLCHGFRSSKDSRTCTELGKILRANGQSTFRFDFSANGESEGTFAYGNYAHEVEDLHAAVLHLRQQNRAPSSVFGHSKGGNVVLLHAAKYAEIPVVVAAAARFDMRKGVSERLGLAGLRELEQNGSTKVYHGRLLRWPKADITIADYGSCYTVTAESLAERYATDMGKCGETVQQHVEAGILKRVMILHGDQDDTVDPRDAEAYAAVIPAARMVILPRCGHSFRTRPEVQAMTEVAAPFLRTS